MGPVTAKPVGPWARDNNAYDPGASVRHVDVDGHLFEVRNLLGPGWPMTVSAAGQHIGMAGWENWDDVTQAAHHHIDTEARGRS